jgi:hypothetical protein
MADIDRCCLGLGTGDSSSLGVILGAVLGSTIPVFILLVLAAILLGVGCWMLGRSKRNGRQDWEIDFDELEVGDILGAGGYCSFPFVSFFVLVVVLTMEGKYQVRRGVPSHVEGNRGRRQGHRL